MSDKNHFHTLKLKVGNLHNTPSFKYRHLIKQVAKPFYEIPNFAGTSIVILLKSGDAAWLSTVPKTTLKIIATGLHRGHLLLDYRYLNSNRVIFPDEFNEIDQIQSAINSILKTDKIYRGYCIVRSCQDCLVLITCNVTHELDNHHAFYEASVDILEASVNEFLDKTINIYTDILPAFSNCQFATRNDYRHQIITTRYATKVAIHLGDSELNVLYWSAQGKSANEIAVITGLTKNTVDTYRQRLTEKLNAENITQAVYLAEKMGFIV